jgi:outer membrane lipoprotein-sorting protein
MVAFRRLARIAIACLPLTALVGVAMAQVPLPRPRPAFGQIDLTQMEALEVVNARFNQMQTMQGQFFQIGPGPNELSEGEFFFARPGLLRLNYYPPSQLVVISNGNVMSVDDRARGTQNFYRLARTPLAPILAETTNLTSEDLVRDVILDREEFIVLVLATADDGSWLSLYFDRQTYDLRQWVTVDARGNTITFVMYETEINQPVDGDYFRILNFRGSG